MTALAGTGRLTRLVLRRDRILLPVWLTAVMALAVGLVSGVHSLYTTAQERIEAAVFAAANVAARVVDGPPSGPDIGSLAMLEAYKLVGILVALMNTQLVLRHTRQNEDTGRAEMLGSAVVGRHAPLTAALLVATAANLVVAAGVTAVLLAHDLPLAGSLASGLAVGALGMIFAGIAGVAAQVMATQRAASAVCAAALGLTYLLRGAGDAFGTVEGDGMVLVSAWPSWLSPMGWGHQVRPFYQDNWDVFGLFALSGTALVALAYFLTTRRDVGEGMLRTRPGPRYAPASLRGSLGIAWRLHRGLLVAWVIGMSVVGTIFGAVGNNVDDVINMSHQIEQLILRHYEGASLVDLYFSFVVSFLAIAAAAYTVQALLRARAEEVAGHVEPVLAAAVGRVRWLLSHVAVAWAGTVVVLVALGLSGSLAYAAVGGDLAVGLGMLSAAVAQVPAAFALGGLVVATFAFLPRWALALGWAMLAASLVMGQAGQLLELPQWLLNLSPFTHVPEVPATALALTPELALLAVAVTATAAGLAWFRRRDLAIGA